MQATKQAVLFCYNLWHAGPSGRHAQERSKPTEEIDKDKELPALVSVCVQVLAACMHRRHVVILSTQMLMDAKPLLKGFSEKRDC